MGSGHHRTMTFALAAAVAASLGCLDLSLENKAVRCDSKEPDFAQCRASACAMRQLSCGFTPDGLDCGPCTDGGTPNDAGIDAGIDAGQDAGFVDGGSLDGGGSVPLLWAIAAGGTRSITGKSVAFNDDGQVVVLATSGAGSNWGQLVAAPGFQLVRFGLDGGFLGATGAGHPTFTSAPAGALVLPGGDVVVAGTFEGTLRLPDAAHELNASDGGDIFVARTDRALTPRWAKQAGAPNEAASVVTTALFADGVLVTGDYAGPAKFGRGEPNETTLAAGGVMTRHAYFARYTLAGSFDWVVRMTGSAVGQAATSTVDGGVIVGGRFTDTVSFTTVGGIPQSLTALPGTLSGFLLHLDQNGKAVWSRLLSNGPVNAVRTAPDGSFLVLGTLRGPMMLGSGEPTQTSLDTVGGNDIYLAHFANTGALRWATRMGSTDDDYGADLSVGSNGDIAVGGRFKGTLGFGAPNAGPTLVSLGLADGLVALFSASGKVEWAHSISGAGVDNVESVSLLGDGTVLATGSFMQTANFTLGINQTKVLSAQGATFTDAFVARFAR